MRHEYSKSYLHALERHLGAEIFGRHARRTHSAKLLAALAGPHLETEWLSYRAVGNIRGSEAILDEVVDKYSAAGARFAYAEETAETEPEPGGRNAEHDLARADRALDFAAAEVPIYFRRRAEEIYDALYQLRLDLGTFRAEEAAPMPAPVGDVKDLVVGPDVPVVAGGAA